MWESSRMMLPEHVDALRRYKTESRRKSRPILDDDRLHELSRLISEAHFRGEPARVVIFGEFEDTEIIGKITRIDVDLRRVKVVVDEESGEYEWVALGDIVDITEV